MNHRRLISVVTCLFLIRLPIQMLTCIFFFNQENPEAPVDELSKEPVLGLTNATVDKANNPGKLKLNVDVVCTIVFSTTFSLKPHSKRSRNRIGYL